MLPGCTDPRDTVEKQTLVEGCLGQIHGWEKPSAESERRKCLGGMRSGL